MIGFIRSAHNATPRKLGAGRTSRHLLLEIEFRPARLPVQGLKNSGAHSVPVEKRVCSACLQNSPRAIFFNRGCETVQRVCRCGIPRMLSLKKLKNKTIIAPMAAARLLICTNAASFAITIISNTRTEPWDYRINQRLPLALVYIQSCPHSCNNPGIFVGFVFLIGVLISQIRWRLLIFPRYETSTITFYGKR